MALNPRIADWPGRVAWIVGASSGIGRATAAALHARGATVIASARDAGGLATLAAACPGVIALPLDVTDRDAVLRAARDLRAQHGRLDLVMHCAGYYRPMRASAFDLTEMLRHQQVNYVGALHLLDAVLPGMLAACQGHISLVASVAGYRGLPNALAYGPTKAALQNLADVLYLDLHERGIGVSVVNPGFVRTPLTAGNDFHMPALLTPEQAAGHIVRGWRRGRYEIHFPRRFTLWLKALSHLGHGLYFATVQRATGL